jgi:putative hemolysin
MIFSIVIIVILLAISAITEMVSISFESLNKKDFINSDTKKSKLILKIIEKPLNFNTLLKIIDNICILLAGGIACEVLVVKFTYLFENTNLTNEIIRNICLIIAVTILTYILLVFKELLPKKIAIIYNKKIVEIFVSIFNFSKFIFYPFIFVINITMYVIEKIFRIESKYNKIIAEDKIKNMIDVYEEQGLLDKQEDYMIKSIMNFDEILVKDILVKPEYVVAINIEDSMEHIKNIIKSTRYTRYPVYVKEENNIIGTIHIKDMIRMTKNSVLAKHIREKLLVNEQENLLQVFNEMEKTKHQMAIVVNGKGKYTGIVTMYDILNNIISNPDNETV